MLVIRVKVLFQVDVGPFHDERVAQANGDRKWFEVEDGVCRGQSNGFVMPAFAVREHFDEGKVGQKKSPA